MSYTVLSHGESIFDVLLNVTGSFSQLFDIVKENNLDSYTPILESGQLLETDSLKAENNRVLLVAAQSPYSCVAIPETSLTEQITELESQLS